MKLALASDAWHPQVNGVVRALSETERRLRSRGWTVELLTPDRFRTIPCPTYPEIRLALGCGRAVAARLDAFAPAAVHIATEGPVGLAARRWCVRNGRPFTTSFHTRFPDYVAVRTGLPADWIWPMIRRFHAPAERVFAVTPTLASELAERRIGPVHRWPLGADLGLFSPSTGPHPALALLPRPILLSVGRVAVEKNLAAFLAADVPGTKVVVGDGPALPELRAAFPQAIFLGALHGPELAAAYAAANLFIFPSRTDTFGLVNIEALASGLPVAGFPVPGPRDILGPRGTGTHGGDRRIGAVHEDLAVAIRLALDADRAACVREAAHYDWERCTDAFVAGLATVSELAPSLAFA
ncbi:glycosyltransferase family 4 protein [Sphingomonas astaxanthinifaciens]|uniref:GDP-mannose-dependent alpha-mannosyltransferase n=1 Tax=Sphingomonas astaxanthinifaciens DSM 22298 TaxID=1123267 RepID=A0ABQ5ZA20_9SPHN|nr:glycosyltransferase family 1 protein [Sphingomonas astaxanthinifaciens]GLR48782.1 GDP-mannose-dependent alpha-mannosyltransferase [Sphingomonas astaxanthinifaciens DSM 22298]